MKLFKSAALALSMSLVACYGAAPPKPPRVPLPPMAEGAGIDVHSDTKTTIENVEHSASSCPQGKGEGDPSCVVTRYTVAEPVSRTTTTASYAAEPISYAQFKVMTDPHWDNKLAQLEDLSHKCQRANVPRYVGLGLMLGGLVSGLIVGAAGSPTGEMGLIYGGVGAGAVSYAFGYLGFGGRQCVEARNLFNEVDMTEAMSWNSVEGGNYATEMKVLADQFNAAHGMGPSAQIAPKRSSGSKAALRMRR